MFSSEEIQGEVRVSDYRATLLSYRLADDSGCLDVASLAL